MKKNNQFLVALFVGISLFGSMNAFSGDVNETSSSFECNKDNELDDEVVEKIAVTVDHNLIHVLIKNKSEGTINIIEATPVASWRLLSKAIGWAYAAYSGQVHTLQPGDELELSFSPKNVLAFYRQDLSRTVSNVRNAFVVATGAVATCAAASHLEPTTTIAAAYKTKTSYDALKNPGARTELGKVKSGSKIVLLEPRFAKESSEDKQDSSTGAAIILDIEAPQGE